MPAPQFTLKRRGMSGIAAAVALLSVLGLLHLLSALDEGWGLFLIIAAPASWMAVLGMRLSRASRRPLAIEGVAIVQYADGREIARVALDQPFEVEYLFKGYFAAMYRIRQGRVVLTFTNRTPGAERLVRDVLGLQWPPMGPAWT